MFSAKKTTALLFALASAAAFAVPVVILPQKATLQEKKAAEELALHLKLATGKSVKTVAENTAPETGKRIFIGNTVFAKKNKADFSKFAQEEHFVKAYSGDTLVIGGGFPRGTLYGVYEFLENNLNAMWLDENNIFIDKVKSVSWKNNLFLHGKPGIPYRSIYSHFGPGSELYKIRNRQNWFHVALPAKFDGFAIPLFFGSPRFNHTFYDYTKDLPEADEDVLALVGGKRLRPVNSAGPGQICYSNPKTVTWFWNKLEKYIAFDRKGKEKWQYPRGYVLATNDNRLECQCDGCQKLVKKHGWSGAKLYFVNQIAKKAAEKYPEIFFKTDSYGLHGFLPTGGIKPEPNVWIGIAYGSTVPGRERDYFRPYTHPINKLTHDLHFKWAKVAKLTIGDYWIDYNRPQFPSTITRTIAENIKFYKKLGVQSIKPECQGAHVTSFWRMRTYIGYRFMVDPDRDVDKEIRRFCNAYYGKGAPYMMALHKLLEEGMAKLERCIDSYPVASRNDLDEEFFKKAEALINAGDKATKDNKLHNERVTDEWSAIAWAKIDKYKVSDKAYVENFRKVALRRMKYQSAYHKRKFIPMVDMLCNAALANLPPLKGFENAVIISEYGWPQLSQQRYTQIAVDPDAAGGKTAVPRGSHAKEKNPARRGIDMGISDRTARKALIKGAGIPEAVVPKDGKYHWYYLGRCRLAGSPLLYMHYSWTLQLALDDAMRPADLYDNDVGVYVHLKHTKDTYAVDRVVVVRGDLSRNCPGSWSLPAGIDKKRIIADLAGTALYGKKIIDKSAAFSCAVPGGSLNKAGKTRIFFFDNTKKHKMVSRLITLPKGGKYQLVSLRKGVLTENCQLKVGRHVIELGNYFELAKPDRKFEIVLSLRADKNGRVLMDRVFLLETK